MRLALLDVLALPGCGHPVEVEHIRWQEAEDLREDSLIDRTCGRRILFSNDIPRFFEQDEAYTSSFGEQWKRYPCTQIDRFNGTTISSRRLFEGTGWTPTELRGQKILDVGCGAGRFTQILLEAGAEVYAIDRSRAVDACWVNNKRDPHLHVVQGDLHRMPFRQGCFDRVFCYGVLQHTPDPKAAFMSLIPFLRSGGKLAMDIYRIPSWPSRWTSKYLWRPITKRMSHDTLFRIVEWYVPRWLPIDNALGSVPLLGRLVSAVVPCWNYTGLLPLTHDQVREWAVLDTFDALASWYDQPRTIEEIELWFKDAGLQDVDVRRGGNGVVGNGRR